MPPSDGETARSGGAGPTVLSRWAPLRRTAGDLQVENASLDYPTGTKGNVSTKAAMVSIANKDGRAEVVAQELNIFAKVALEDAIPQGNARAEAVRIEFNYKTSSFPWTPKSAI